MQVEGRKQFVCDFCSKVCKSKGGLTRHRNSKHPSEQGQSSRAVPQPTQIVSSEKVRAFIGDIGQHLTDEKLHKKEYIAEVSKLHPSDSFVQFLNTILSKFKRRKNHNKLLEQFYGKTTAHWKEYFNPCKDQKIVFLMLIHLPERLVSFLEDSQDTSSAKV